MESYYDILGVSKSATDKEIRQAYRRLARKYHPDLNPGNAEAEKKFKRINEAYEVLSNPESRKKYDLYGENWKYADRIEAQYGKQPGGSPFEWVFRQGSRGQQPGARSRRGRPGTSPDFDDFNIFEGLDDLIGGFGGPFRQGAGASTATRLETSVEVSLEEAYSGTRRLLSIQGLDRERRIEAAIPPGVDTGSVVHLSLSDGQELFINVTVLPHQRFQRKGNDLYTEVEVPFEDAILGGEVPVQTLKGRVMLKVPPESQNGQKVRLAGLGMPKLGSPEVKGDLYVILRPVMPRNLTEQQRELVRKLKELRTGGRQA